MSTGNAGAALGLVNTSKVAAIGGFVQRTPAATVLDAQTGNVNPAAGMGYMGTNGVANYDYNALGEAIGFTHVAATQGVNATAKTAQWVQLGVGGLTNAQTGVTIVAGVATFNAVPTHRVYASLYANRTLPINTYCWAFEI